MGKASSDETHPCFLSSSFITDTTSIYLPLHHHQTRTSLFSHQSLFHTPNSSPSDPTVVVTMSCSRSTNSSTTHLYDLPDVILSNIFGAIIDTRSRNAMSLVSHKWLILERSTRTSLTLRGNVRNLFMIPSSYRSVTHLDLSLLSPWGHSLLPDTSNSCLLLAQLIHRAFPSLQSLILYSRTPSTIQLLAPLYTNLRHIKLIRWHQRCSSSPLGADFIPLLQNCHSLTSLDLSQFYCWTEDFPAALQSHPLVAASLTHLDLLTQTSAEGFMSQQLIEITAACPNLRSFRASCNFDPRYIDSVGDETLLGIAGNCPNLTHLHLCDASVLFNSRGDPDDQGFTSQDSKISVSALESFFTALPMLEELFLDICHNVMLTSPALEMLNAKCPQLKSLKLGQFHGICKAVGRQLDGVAACRGLESLFVKNSVGLTDTSLTAIALGCPRLARFHVQGCKEITEMGMKTFARVLRQTLIEVKIYCCKNLEAACALRALEPIRSTIQTLHIDCVWHDLDLERHDLDLENQVRDFDLNEVEQEENEDNLYSIPTKRIADYCETSMRKKPKYSTDIDCPEVEINGGWNYWNRSWDRLQCLSLWIAVGDLLSPLPAVGLEDCPVLEEIQIKVEGDCRRSGRPSDNAFGLTCLAGYPQLSKMKLDCGETIGYALTAPTGQMDLSLWERFYLSGIGNLNLNEIDYWPPQDRDVNQRSLSLPAAGLLAECTTLRKLYIHGTAHEHFMMFLLRIPNLRECQLREDYYPAPEDDMSTEMRVTSCSRFEDALNRRIIPD